MLFRPRTDSLRRPLLSGLILLLVAFSPFASSAAQSGPPAGAADGSAQSVPAPGSGPPAEFASPRATFSTFLEAMSAVRGGDESRWPEVLGCLDLEDIAPAARGQAGRKFARDLKTYLDKTELVRIDELPLSSADRRWVWRRGAAGEVSLVRADDGRWLFSRITRDALPELLASVRGKKFVEGLEGAAGGGATIADSLRALLPPALQRRTFLLENWQWLALLSLVLAGVIIDRALRFVLGVQARRALGRRLSGIDPGDISRFGAPVGVLAMALLWLLSLPLLDLPINVFGVLDPAVRVIMAVAGVWAAYRFVDLLSAYFALVTAETESKLDDLLVPMIRRALKIAVIAFGLVFVAQNLNIPIASLVTGLGLGGLAFALAAKDTVENLFGSLTVLIDRPFQLGDWIVLGDLEGTVVEVGLRSTRVRTFYNSVITIPNSKLVSAAVDNLGAREYRRIKCFLSVQYDTPPERIEALCEGMRELVRQHPYTRKDYYNIYLNRFGASGLDILFYVFHRAPDWTTELRERHRLFLDILRLAQSLGVEFAFPTQTLHLASVPEGFGGAAPPPPPPAPDPLERIVASGRERAQQISRETWGETPQPPVDFTDPDRIRPAGRG